ncbi:MAG: tail fiber protein [Thalassospira sp.]|nr:tail fiber protein [Thalassospira sp.]
MPYVNTADGHLYVRNAANTAWIDHGLIAERVLRAGDIAAGGSAGLLRADGDGSGLTGIDSIPVGFPFYWPASSPPAWALELDGSAVSRASYSALFAIVGTVFGAGDGSTTFNLPDIRGEFIRGWDNGRGVDTGRLFGSTQLDQMQQITGSVRVYGGISGAFTDGGAQGNFGGGVNSFNLANFDSAGSPGARVGSETRARNVALLPCIKF